MKHSVKLLTALSVGSLMGCAPMSLPPTQAGAGARGAIPARTQQVETFSKSAAEVEGLFIVGRAAHGANELAKAEALYVQVLQHNPSHLGALNSVAVIYAQTERGDQAQEFFKRAINLDPKSSHLHNNYGYALLRAGRLTEAGAELKLAQELNPSSVKTQENLALWTQASERAAARLEASGVEISRKAEATGPQLVVVAPSVYELRDASPSPAKLAQATQAATEPVKAALAGAGKPPVVGGQPAATALRGVRMEVSNGVGIRHLAKRTAQRLTPMGVDVVRLTNQPGFMQPRTEIQFSAGYKTVATALSEKFFVTMKAVPSTRLTRNVQVRLVLGHDVAGRAFAAWLDSTPDVELASTGFDGWRWS